jgi:hypothetical protein
MEQSDILLDLLDSASEEEILSIITMSLAYYLKKFNRSLPVTLTLIRKGLIQLEKYKGE